MTNLNDENKLSNAIDDNKSMKYSPVNETESSKTTLNGFESNKSNEISDNKERANSLSNWNESVQDSYLQEKSSITNEDDILLENMNNMNVNDESEAVAKLDGATVKSLEDSETNVSNINSSESNNSDVEEFIKKQLIENPKDRLFMLNIEKSMIDFINDDKQDFFKFLPMNRYYRMFVHRIGEYFGLGHNLDQSKQCIIVNKIKKTEIPHESFQSIISKANFGNRPSSSTALNSKNASLTNTTDEKSNEQFNHDNGNQLTKKHKILKREVNIHDGLAEKNKSKALNESNRPKTFEEKSADYNRIKNRIFSEKKDDIETKTDLRSTVIDHNQSENSSSIQNVSIDDKQAQKYTILHRYAENVNNEKNNLVMKVKTQNSQNENNEISKNHENTYLMSQPITNNSTLQSSFKNSKFRSHSNYGHNSYKKTPFQKQLYSNNMYNIQQPFNMLQGQSQKSFTISHPNSSHQPHSMHPNHLIASNSMQEVSHVPMQGLIPQNNFVQLPQVIANNQAPLFVLKNNSQMISNNNNNIATVNFKQSKNHGFQNQFLYLQSPDMKDHPLKQNEQNNDAPNNLAFNLDRRQIPFNHAFNQLNISQPYPLNNQYVSCHQNQFINPQLPYQPTLLQHQQQLNQPSVFNSIAFQQALFMNEKSFSNNQVYSNNLPMHQMTMNQNYSNIIPNSDNSYQSIKTNQNFPNQKPNINENKASKYNRKLNTSQPKIIKNTSTNNGFKGQQRSRIQASPSFDTQQPDTFQSAYIHSMSGQYVQNGSFSSIPKQSNSDDKVHDTSFSEKNDLVNNNTKSVVKSSDLDINSEQKQSKNKKPEKYLKKRKRLKEKILAAGENNKSSEENSSSSNLMVQVYNINQDLTKQMLQDLLEPYVISIDFKIKSNSKISNSNSPECDSLLLKTSINSVDADNHTINEENLDVIIQFENQDKLDEALTSFNLQDLQGSKNRNEIKISEELKDMSYSNQHSLQNQSPFLFKPLSIF